jgi:hypothetical protein
MCADEERRVAVQHPIYNSWLAEQGIGGDEFPLGGGSAPAYP